MPEIATTPDDAYRACHPERPVQPSQEDIYVSLDTERGGSTNLTNRFLMPILTEDLPIGQPCIGLVSGHRGCGKTSDLLRLKAALEQENCHVIYCDVEETLGLSDVDDMAVLLLIIQEIANSMETAGKTFSEELVLDCERFFATVEERTSTSRESSLTVEAQAEAGGGIPLIGKLLARFTSGIKVSADSSVEVRREIKQRFGEFSLRLNMVVQAARDQLGGKPLVVIVDGLEKLHYFVNDGISNHEALFIKGAPSLRSLKCHVIYTVPMSLAYEENLGTEFSDQYTIPMIDVEKPAGFEGLREVLARRFHAESIFLEPEESVNDLIRASGGCLRDLLRLAQMSMIGAQEEKVSLERVQAAINDVSIEYSRLIRTADKEEIMKILEAEECDGTGRQGELLHNRVVLEYRNGDRYCRLHPLVERTRRVQKWLDAQKLLVE